MENKTKSAAVLLMAYGSPETAGDVAPYFTHIRGGVRPDEKLITEIEERYQRVGGKTPLFEITKQQAAKLQELLDERAGYGKFKVYVGMKHWHPFIKDTLAEIRKEGIQRVIAIALAPHYSKMSIGGYEKFLAEAGEGLDVELIESWHTNEHFIAGIVEQVNAALAENMYGGRLPHLVFTAHSLPERIRAWNDPYEAQLLETSQLIASHFPDYEWSFSFQSAGHTKEPWLGPNILDTLADLKKKGKGRVLITSIGFVSDNLEILFDLDIEAREAAKRLGISLARTEMRNTHPLFMEALYDITMHSQPSVKENRTN